MLWYSQTADLVVVEMMKLCRVSSNIYRKHRIPETLYHPPHRQILTLIPHLACCLFSSLWMSSYRSVDFWCVSSNYSPRRVCWQKQAIVCQTAKASTNSTDAMCILVSSRYGILPNDPFHLRYADPDSCMKWNILPNIGALVGD